MICKSPSLQDLSGLFREDGKPVYFFLYKLTEERQKVIIDKILVIHFMVTVHCTIRREPFLPSFTEPWRSRDSIRTSSFRYSRF